MMISGHFSSVGSRNFPFLRCYFDFPHDPSIGTKGVDLLVDTGAERTTLSRVMAESVGLNIAALPDGGTSIGVGGATPMRIVESRLSVQSYSTPFLLYISESCHQVPSILGRDFIRRFALFMEERTRRVLFLDQTDIDMFGLAALGSP
jgi:hypothetical protein